MKIKKGDNVIVIAGKDKGKSGSVFRALPKLDQVIIEGVNTVKRHQRARQRGSQGQIVEKPMPIDVSNVALTDAKSGKPGRVGYTFEGEGKDRKKVRVVRGGKPTAK